MKEKEYLNEHVYNKNKNKILLSSLIIFIVLLLIGGSLIAVGIINSKKIDKKYSKGSKEKLELKLNEEQESLERIKDSLEEKGIVYSAFATYDNDEMYELKIITQALSPSFDYCKFDEYKNNKITSNYCSIKLQIEDLNTDFNRISDNNKNIIFFMFGGFIIFAGIIISGSIYMFAKRREIMAFTIQQTMPIAKEGIEKLAPFVNETGRTMAKENLKEMTPYIADASKTIAKEISNGIKESKTDQKQCPYCHSIIDTDSMYCKSCGKKI